MGCSASAPNWPPTPARENIFGDACPPAMEEWAFQWKAANDFDIGIYRLKGNQELPKFCFCASAGSYTMCDIREGKTDRKSKFIIVTPGWNPAPLEGGHVDPKMHIRSNMFALKKATDIMKRKKASRSIIVAGFDKTVQILKVSDAAQEVNTSVNTEVVIDGIKSTKFTSHAATPTARFEIAPEGCSWLPAASPGDCVAEIVLAMLPNMPGHKTGQTDGSAINPKSFLKFVQAPKGLRLSTKLALDEKQLLMGACASFVPFLLGGCELTLGAAVYLNGERRR